MSIDDRSREAEAGREPNDASDTLGQSKGTPEAREPSASEETADPAKSPPRQFGGIASSLQPGGTSPGGGPGASTGSIGTGGGSTGGNATGSVKRAL